MQFFPFSKVASLAYFPYFCTKEAVSRQSEANFTAFGLSYFCL